MQMAVGRDHAFEGYRWRLPLVPLTELPLLLQILVVGRGGGGGRGRVCGGIGGGSMVRCQR